MSPTIQSVAVSDVIRRKLIFVSGKGGVGKTVVSHAIAEGLADAGGKTLWVGFEDPSRPAGELKKVNSHLSELNCEATSAFEEYVSMKIGVPALTRIFLQNKVMRSLSKAAPGIHELVLLGKVWYETQNYDHVVVDMPSTGYGLAMFQSAQNFANLFGGGPIHRDAEAMLETFRDPGLTGQLIVALPEEMPLRESLELAEFLLRLFPKNAPAFLANRVFPLYQGPRNSGKSTGPLAADAADYAQKRNELEEYNLRIWRDENVDFGKVGFLPPPLPAGAISEQLKARGVL